MLEDFRDQANEASYFEDNDIFNEMPPPVEKHFLGMTPGQRLLIALLLFFIVCLLGSFTLLVTEKIVLPFI